MLKSVDPNNQAFEVSPALGFQVKSESLSTDSVSVNENRENCVLGPAGPKN